MTAITVRLTEEDHKLLQLYCMVTGRSQNSIMVELLHNELDRALPGKREAVRGARPGAVWEALGVAVPEPGPQAKAWAAGVVDSLRDDSSADRSAA
jgi:hypothetical protein